MKFVTGIVATLVIGSLSFGAFAAKEIEKDKLPEMIKSEKLVKVGTITTSDTTAPMDAKRELSKKADEKGGQYYVIIAADKGDKYVHANADVYKKQ
ncbi:MAG: DUF1471 domain-containing protein [Yokenella regensburgei]|jgi:hypothetical protein|uniref:Multiple stress resistance protein BhsA n=1 Tax=Yokenella regensburgei TaxID=158877 RepID=A0AB38FYQ6_9ENTR|nr:YdgH/BhsA/McbA-like domain containing protein [Yokenella regensburgei]EHM50419.1 hypothetical protein HMPREF0880_01067 [Yokenella regensburgei ATCC 43003]KAF1369501.1 hypothetical protein FHR25_001789 [Yokenella regensburgei]KFD24317.1 putative exported protein [Yokenella regensburgei ATCC 49455]MDQ4430066.1 DUF1471 domain-containing protein [Yokenella regensburgei]MDR2217929.1 DUF1471 domain-containing protein [Yokenella regensburgei]